MPLASLETLQQHLRGICDTLSNGCTLINCEGCPTPTYGQHQNKFDSFHGISGMQLECQAQQLCRIMTTPGLPISFPPRAAGNSPNGVLSIRSHVDSLTDGSKVFRRVRADPRAPDVGFNTVRNMTSLLYVIVGSVASRACSKRVLLTDKVAHRFYQQHQ